MNRYDAAAEIAEASSTLGRAGWSVGVAIFIGPAGDRVWLVSGSNGENMIQAEGPTEVEAWRGALAQARSIGMVLRPRV